MVFGFIPECRSASLRKQRSASPESSLPAHVALDTRSEARYEEKSSTSAHTTRMPKVLSLDTYSPISVRSAFDPEFLLSCGDISHDCAPNVLGIERSLALHGPVYGTAGGCFLAPVAGGRAVGPFTGDDTAQVWPTQSRHAASPSAPGFPWIAHGRLYQSVILARNVAISAASLGMPKKTAPTEAVGCTIGDIGENPGEIGLLFLNLLRSA